MNVFVRCLRNTYTYTTCTHTTSMTSQSFSVYWIFGGCPDRLGPAFTPVDNMGVFSPASVGGSPSNVTDREFLTLAGAVEFEEVSWATPSFLTSFSISLCGSKVNTLSCRLKSKLNWYPKTSATLQNTRYVLRNFSLQRLAPLAEVWLCICSTDSWSITRPVSTGCTSSTEAWKLDETSMLGNVGDQFLDHVNVWYHFLVFISVS